MDASQLQLISMFLRDYPALVNDSIDGMNLATIFVDLQGLIDSLLSLILSEMFKTRRDILYWTELIKVYRSIISLFDQTILTATNLISGNDSDPSSVSNQVEEPLFSLWKSYSKNIEDHLALLKADFNGLAILLCNVNEAVSHLKAIYLEIEYEPISVNLDTKSIPPGSIALVDVKLGPTQIQQAQKKRKYESCKLRLSLCLQSLNKCLFGLFPNFYQYPIVLDANEAERIKQVIECDLAAVTAVSMEDVSTLFSALDNAVNKLIHVGKSESYLLSMSLSRFRPPSNFEKYWLRNLFMSATGLYVSFYLWDKYRDGSLKTMIQFSSEYLSSKLKEHIVEPLTQLGRELFESIRKREEIVSLHDLEQSRQALGRMLDDFSKSQRGSDLMNLPASLQEQQRIITDIFFKNKGGSFESAPPTPTTTLTPEELMQAMGKMDSKIISTKAMEALMSEYEKELQTPIKGIMFGSLMTAILIQMQKLKVHTEAAMLTMDQILASNQLTIAVTAAMPAFGLLGLSLWYLRNQLRPKTSTIGDSTLTFRLIMSDVERSLQELEDLQLTSDRNSTTQPNPNPNPNLAGKKNRTSRLRFSQEGDGEGPGMDVDELNPDEEIKDNSGKGSKLSLEKRDHQLVIETPIHTLSSSSSPRAAVTTPSTPTQGSPTKQRFIPNPSSSTTSSFFRSGSGDSSMWRTSSGKGDELFLSSKTLLEDAVKGRTSVVALVPPSERKLKVARGKYYFNLCRLRHEFGELFDIAAYTSSHYLSSPSSPSSISSTTTSTSNTSSTASNSNSSSSSSNASAKAAANNKKFLEDRFAQDMPPFLRETNSRNESSGISNNIVTRFFRTALDIFNATVSVVISPQDISWHAVTQYKSIHQDLQLLEAPDFEVSMRRKLATVQRMRTSYKCLAPVT